MKVATYNIRGLNGPDKLRSLWNWILSQDLDIICIQEHRLTPTKDNVSYCNNYTQFFGDGSSGSSGVLTIIKNSINPKCMHNHPSGRCSVVSIQSNLGFLHVTNVYGPSASHPRCLLWDWLCTIPQMNGLICDDFNVVCNKQDTITQALLLCFQVRKYTGRPFLTIMQFLIYGSTHSLRLQGILTILQLMPELG